jgi:hypothetical protein
MKMSDSTRPPEPKGQDYETKVDQKTGTADTQVPDFKQAQKSTKQLVDSPDYQELLKRAKKWFYYRSDCTDVLRNAVKELFRIFLIDHMDNLELGCNVRDCDMADCAYNCFATLSDFLNQNEVDQIVAEIKEKMRWSDSYTGEPFSGRGCHSKPLTESATPDRSDQVI